MGPVSSARSAAATSARVSSPSCTSSSSSASAASAIVRQGRAALKRRAARRSSAGLGDESPLKRAVGRGVQRQASCRPRCHPKRSEGSLRLTFGGRWSRSAPGGRQVLPRAHWSRPRAWWPASRRETGTRASAGIRPYRNAASSLANVSSASASAWMPGMSCSSGVSSAGEWLRPSWLGTKIMAAGIARPRI